MARAYYLKGVIYQQQKNTSAMVENLQLAIDKGTASSDNATAKNASTTLRTYYYNAGIQALQAKKYADAIPNFEGAVKADPAYADAYWRLASCYNSTSKFDDAVANANKGLEYKTGADKDKAGLYYELGVAYAGKKDVGNACGSFKKALFEPYAAAAKYQIETALKCK
jgi:tetratricopeptide (TPR) repeat protein